MGVKEIIALTVFGFFLLLLLLRILAKPLSLVLKLLLNTALGFLALGAVDLLTPYIGLHVPFNLWNALTVGVLGAPGLLLLLVLQWIF